MFRSRRYRYRIALAALGWCLGALTAACGEPPSGPLSIGQPASPADIARWDRDIGPDGAGLPDGDGTAAAARLGRQQEHQVAATARAVQWPVPDAQKDREVHGPARRRHDSPVQLRHGRALDHHVPGLPADPRARLDRDPRTRVVRSRAHHGRRYQYRCRAVMDSGDAASARITQGAYAVPGPVALGRSTRRDPERAHDETGYVQPTRAQLDSARGAPSGPLAYHYNPITGWRIDSDGAVFFTPGSEHS